MCDENLENYYQNMLRTYNLTNDYLNELILEMNEITDVEWRATGRKWIQFFMNINDSVNDWCAEYVCVYNNKL